MKQLLNGDQVVNNSSRLDFNQQLRITAGVLLTLILSYNRLPEAVVVRNGPIAVIRLLILDISELTVTLQMKQVKMK